MSAAVAPVVIPPVPQLGMEVHDVKAPADAVTELKQNVNVVVSEIPVRVEKNLEEDTTNDGSEPPPPKTIPEKARAAAEVLNRYRIEYTNDWDIPESIARAQVQVEEALNRGDPVELVLPAFPFKSSNKTKKVLGRFPDEAERLSLLHLQGLCDGIKDAAEIDSVLTIVSDGVVYNDILGVSDEEVWSYGQALREMATTLGCHSIRFARLCDLVNGQGNSTTLNEATYLEEAGRYRDSIQANIPDGFNAVDAIANDPNIAKTYTGYKKFLATEREERQGRSRSQTERENASIAKSMITRGKAFAETVKKNFPQSVRLSIHPSNDKDKISVKLLPQENAIPMTPWHGAVVRGADGSVSMAYALSVPALTHEIVYKDGRPSYFRERSNVFSWPGMDLTFEYLYPCGIMIKPTNPASGYTLASVDMQKVRTLAETCSPIVLRGFANTKDRRTYIAKAHDLGEIFMWKSLVTVVKDSANDDPRSSVAFSSEAMPMEVLMMQLQHFDGIFKVVKVKDEKTGEEKKVSDPPRMQYFVSQSAAQPGDGYTLFASSSLFTKYLPQAYPIHKLENLKWTCDSYGHYHHTLSDIPLVVRHPTLNTPCMRWHSPWPKYKTAYGHAEIKIDNGSQAVIPMVDTLLYDRRVCLRFSWEEGDVLVSDNVSMLHTRTSFNNSKPRELWRIHTY
ncbi:Pyoverdine/dityrosine biosynthesis protein-domain-containing protein [Xylariaceae sp. FL1019]|nr:Pyoverdine/dityrosine biosynthesis protein-domain-containing protein [Xylariaceae sp. FL1019]